MSLSGCHLGHFKALVQDPILLGALTQFMNLTQVHRLNCFLGPAKEVELLHQSGSLW